MTQRAGIFPTFFLSGFECSTFLWRDKGRRDLSQETQHTSHAEADYRLLHELGIAVAREGIPWPHVDRGARCYDFTCVDPLIAAMNAAQILPIWDLCHYGYPDDADPWRPDFAARFADYCGAAAEHVCARVRGPHFFTPINEITFWGFAGGEWGWIAPFGDTKTQRLRLRDVLCRAAIAGVKAIREVDPTARMVHVEPVIRVVAPDDRPDLAEAARIEMEDDACHAWDVLAGKANPEFGGAPEVLDIVGANCYSFGQMEYREHGPHQALGPDDPRIRPLCELLSKVWQRYRRPMIIAETSGLHDGREEWLKDVMEEALAVAHRRMAAQRPVRPHRRRRRLATGSLPTLHRRAAALAAVAQPRDRARRGSVQRPGRTAGRRRSRPAHEGQAGPGLVLTPPRDDGVGARSVARADLSSPSFTLLPGSASCR